MGGVHRFAWLAGAWAWCLLPVAILAEVPGPERLWPAATFDDGNDKEAVVDLRARKARGEALTAMEEAILVAAARTGVIASCSGEQTSNAFLVRIDGRDAVITSAHAFFDEAQGKPICDLTNAYYYPNMSFFDKEDGDPKPSEYERKKAATVLSEPLYRDEVLALGELALDGTRTINVKNDFLIFFLKDSISSDVLPDRAERGYLRFAEDLPRNGQTVLIGTDPNFRNGGTSTYQLCPIESLGPNSHTFFHACDTLPGVSSSALLSYVRGEFKVLGMHVRGLDEVGLDASDSFNWNTGVSFVPIRTFLEEQGLTVE